MIEDVAKNSDFGDIAKCNELVEHRKYWLNNCGNIAFTKKILIKLKCYPNCRIQGHFHIVSISWLLYTIVIQMTLGEKMGQNDLGWEDGAD